MKKLYLQSLRQGRTMGPLLAIPPLITVFEAHLEANLQKEAMWALL